MIVKGKSRSNGLQLGAYLLSMEANEEVRVLEISGMATDDLTQALIEMQEITDRGQRGVKGLYHSIISPQPGYQLTEEQWLYAADVLAKQLKLHDQPRAIVLHEKADGQGGTRTHAHIVFQRTDREKLILIPDSWNYPAHERAARHLEQKFGHEIVPGKHAEPREKDRSAAPDHERHQEARGGLTKEERIAQVTELLRQSDGAKGFAASLAHTGYTLAKGDRRDFVILDKAGSVYSLPRCIEGVKIKELRKFFEPIDASTLPTVDQAKAVIRDRLVADKDRAQAKDKAKAEFEKAASTSEPKQLDRTFNEKAEATRRDSPLDQIPPREVQAIREKAKKAFEVAGQKSGLERYGQALGDRIRASATLARRVATALGDKYRAIANRFSERWRDLKKSIGGGKGKAGGHGAAIDAPVVTPTKHTTAFNKAAKALIAVERQAREDQSRKGPSHDR